MGEPVYLPFVLALCAVCATVVLWRALRGGRPVDRLDEKVVLCALCECTSVCGAAGLRPCGAAADLCPPLISARLVLLCQASSFLARLSLALAREELEPPSLFGARACLRGVRVLPREQREGLGPD